MRKTNFLYLFLLSAFTLSFMACSDDDNKTTNTNIADRWLYRPDITKVELKSSHKTFSDSLLILVKKDLEKKEYFITYKEDNSYDVVINDTVIDNGTYTYNESILVLTNKNSVSKKPVHVDFNNMIMSQEVDVLDKYNTNQIKKSIIDKAIAFAKDSTFKNVKPSDIIIEKVAITEYFRRQ